MRGEPLSLFSLIMEVASHHCCSDTQGEAVTQDLHDEERGPPGIILGAAYHTINSYFLKNFFISNGCDFFQKLFQTLNLMEKSLRPSGKKVNQS